MLGAQDSDDAGQSPGISTSADAPLRTFSLEPAELSLILLPQCSLVRIHELAGEGRSQILMPCYTLVLKRVRGS